MQGVPQLVVVLVALVALVVLVVLPFSLGVAIVGGVARRAAATVAAVRARRIGLLCNEEPPDRQWAIAVGR